MHEQPLLYMCTLNHFSKGMAVGCVHCYTDNKLGQHKEHFLHS